MITLITGLPGNGKTLYALWSVQAIAQKENRPVFYAGIKGLSPDLGWHEIDPEKWFECPDGAIIVIDECQAVFRPRPNGQTPPEHVARLETHRHHGHDLYLITQHPLLADTAVRRLTGRHLHVVRRFGTQTATIHEWPQAEVQCEKPAGRKDSIKHAWKYPKDVFNWYKSAEVHTVKRNIPGKVWGLLLLILLLIALCGYIYKSMRSKIKPEEKPAAEASAVHPGPAAQASAAQSDKLRVSYKNAAEDMKQYAFESTPRIDGLPHTAPRYDEITKPVTAPVPVACVASANRCSCFSQQGTVMYVPDGTCRDIVARGFFLDFDDGGGKPKKRDGESEDVVRPDAVPIRVASNEPAVLVLPFEGVRRVGDAKGGVK